MVTGRRLHTAVWGLAAVVIVAVLGMVVVTFPHEVGGGQFVDRVGVVVFGMVPVAFAVTGAMIVANQPRNAVGWLLMVLAVGALANLAVDLLLPESPPAHGQADARLLGLLTFVQWSWVLLVFPIFHLLLVFPDGRLVSRRWRVVVLVEVVMVTVMVVLGTFTTRLGPLDAGWTVHNPIGFLPMEVFDRIIVAWTVGLVVVPVAGVTALVIRFRRAGVVQRHQIKWLLYGAGVFALVYILLALVAEWENQSIVDVLLGSAMIGLAVAIAMAVLRQHLYEIDRIVSRTVGYTLVMGTLGLVYLVGAVWLPARLTNSSPLFVAGSTLVVAALFDPVRRRIVHLVDGRFYRAAFDAEPGGR